ncbi:MAG: cytochrome c, mono- and diheme variant family [Bacteroidota bacterium]|nr:cytochrome c, mono- and diheme variant family [Bacteroidota bacterium]
MMTTIKILFLLFALSFTACNNSPTVLVNVLKIQPGDPFKNTMVASQNFDIDTRKDNVVEGNKGTMMVFPKGCFKNAKGDIIEKNVKVELAEALSYKDMLVSNLTTTSNGKPLETDGMIYFNATADGEQLAINKENPVHIEIPTQEKKPGMMVYKGNRDKNGNMDWTEPKELDNYLVPVDLELLDFIPKEYESALEQEVMQNGFPFKNGKTVNKQQSDSLYYTFTPQYFRDLIKRIWKLETRQYDYNEPYYNKKQKVVKGKYTKESYEENDDVSGYDTTWLHNYDHWGLDVSAIKVLKSKKFERSLVATREFQERVQALHYVGDNSILDMYVKNLDKNLYELDSMAWKAIPDTNRQSWRDQHGWHDGTHFWLAMDTFHAEKFHKFYLQHLGKVKDGDKNAALLKDYYGRQLLLVKAESEKQREKIVKAVEKKDKEFDKLVTDYEKVLGKREKYRMETYGFNWTETGWINIDNGTLPKTWGPQPLQVSVSNGNNYQQVYTYVIYKSIKSLYRLNGSDNQQFYAGNSGDKSMLMPKHAMATLIAIGYNGDSSALAVKEFDTGSELKFELQLLPSNASAIKDAIAPYEDYKKENKISVDLAYMKQLYQQKVQAKEELADDIIMQTLWIRAHPWEGEFWLEPAAASH